MRSVEPRATAHSHVVTGATEHCRLGEYSAGAEAVTSFTRAVQTACGMACGVFSASALHRRWARCGTRLAKTRRLRCRCGPLRQALDSLREQPLDMHATTAVPCHLLDGSPRRMRGETHASRKSHATARRATRCYAFSRKSRMHARARRACTLTTCCPNRQVAFFSCQVFKLAQMESPHRE